jgi:uncharacterized protein (DUF885 family)
VSRAALLGLLLLAGCQSGQPDSPAQRLDELADRYYAWALARQPERAYFSAVELSRHDGLFDNTPAALREAEHTEDAFLAEILAIDAAALAGSPEWIARTLIEQELRSSIGQRVCRYELWAVNQMDGWQLAYPQVASLQPVDTAEHRQQALVRWSRFADWIGQEIENLDSGLVLGYSSPQAVVRRVIDQVDGLLQLGVDDSPFYSAAVRSDDAGFGAALRVIVSDSIRPALQRYRDYLADSYLPQAREALSITANPDGAACYEASLRAYTTLDRSGREVYELGRQAVAANRAGVIELGKAAYGLDDYTAILDAAKADPGNRFGSRDELLDFSKDMVSRAEAATPEWVGTMPGQAVVVVPFPEHEEGTGRSAHYNPGNSGRPAEYRIPLFEPDKELRGNAEATAFHETWPGHHLQVATFQAIEGLHPVTRIIWFSGPVEGWARYAEGLAEEMGLYTTRSGPILRRAWPARGMVVDPGIHLFGWTRAEASAFMLESGRFAPERVDDMVDRIAILPGQLTAYDSGGLEVLALRHEAQQALGEAFDIRRFHDRVLQNSTMPLADLRRQIEAWIDAQR